jgi:large subunit ribosomal protein L23
MYEILRRPILTEKSAYQSSELNQVVFEVTKTATKAQIKAAIESIFEVSVVKVRTMVMPAKRKSKLYNRRAGLRRRSYKKAIITLATGDSIDVFEGVM